LFLPAGAETDYLRINLVKDLPYESGRSRRWQKIKNPDAPAARRIEEGTF